MFKEMARSSGTRRRHAPWHGSVLRSGFLFLLLFVLPAAADERPTIGLALGSGGARGLAHIAMLEVFDELNVRPDHIAGTSIGAIIGALYASGKSAAEIRALVDSLVGQDNNNRQNAFLDPYFFRWISFLDPGLGEGGLLRGDKFIAFLSDAINADAFEELAIPLQVIATDLNSHEQVLFDAGPLAPAIQASMAIPGIFSPVTVDDRTLADGALVNPVPFDVLFETCDLVVAVSVIGTADPIDKPSFMESIYSATRILQKSIVREKKLQRPPDILIEPPLEDIHVLEFWKFDQVDSQAQAAARQLRTELQKALKR